MKLAAGYNPTGGNGWISSPPHHQHPSSRHHGLRLEGCYQTNMCQKSQCKWPGVYVVLHRNYYFLYLHFAFDKCFEKCFVLSFVILGNTWITSWFGQEHTTTILCPLSSLFYDVTSCGVLSHHRTTWTWCGVASDSLSAPVVGSTTTGLRWWVGREPLGLEEVVQFEKKFLY